ncbi:MAG: ATP-binding protein [Desulfobacterales bacterium]|nr:ATP-binding protein [Desulfobacterales bacterium]
MNRKDTPNNLYYHSLTRKLILIVIIVSLTPMILVIGIILEQFRSSHHEKVRAHLKELVLKHKQHIDGFLNEKLSDLRFTSKSFSLDELRNENFLRGKLTELKREYNAVFEDLGLINADGFQVAYAGPFGLANALYSQSDWFKKAIKSDFYISDVFLGLRGIPHFIIAVKQNRQGDDWILRTTIDFKSFNSLVESIRIGKTGSAFILNKAGEFQTTSQADAVADKETYLHFIDSVAKSKDGIDIIEKKDEAGRKRIFVAASLKHGDWLLIYRQDAADAYADFNRTQKIALAIFLLGALAIITMAFLVSKRMVSRIAKADREKEMMNQQVIETGKLASIGELAAGIAHEINNPVAIMVEEAGWIQDLLSEEEFGQSQNLEEFNRALKQINTQGKRCKEITHKLLSFARKTDPRVHEVQINTLIQEVVGISDQRAKYSNVTIHTDLTPDLPLTEVSPTEFQQVFLNLINNALDAMEKKGGTLNISSRLEEDRVVVTVSDNGPGIPREYLARIFDPFFTTKAVGKGTGLGLSICYGIVKKIGGEIDVRSVLEEGTTFDVKLPISKKTEIISDAK